MTETVGSKYESPLVFGWGYTNDGDAVVQVWDRAAVVAAKEADAGPPPVLYVLSETQADILGKDAQTASEQARAFSVLLPLVIEAGGDPHVFAKKASELAIQKESSKALSGLGNVFGGRGLFG